MSKDTKGSSTPQSNTGISLPGNTLPSTEVLNFAADAGAGLEGADKDSFALPFIAILQGLSPQLETVEGAKIGSFINTISNKLGAAVNVVPCAFSRKFLEWEPRDKGGNFRGMHDVAEVEAANFNKDDKGQIINAEGNILKDTRIHYVLVVEEDGTFSPAIISLASTQIKKSKRWLSRIQNLQMKGPDGKFFTPPSFSHIYRCTAVKESNDSGSWFGWDINMLKPVDDAVLYRAAKALHSQVAAGAIVAGNPVPESDDTASGKF